MTNGTNNFNQTQFFGRVDLEGHTCVPKFEYEYGYHVCTPIWPVDYGGPLVPCFFFLFLTLEKKQEPTG